MTKFATASLIAAGLLGLAPAAQAHIVLDQPKAEAGTYYASAFRVGHGCDGSATTKLTITMPESLVTVRPQLKPGWTITIEKAKLAAPIQGEGGKAITERVASITWEGRLDPDYFDEFGVSTKLPAEPGTLYFPAVQTCEAGSIAWTDIPASGQAWHDVAHPAPVLDVAAAVGGHAAPSQAVVGTLSVTDAWIRASAGGNGAAYATITNSGGEADRLVAVKGDLADAIEIHEVAMADGVMQMRAVDGLDVPAGGSAELKPGGYHIMMIGLKGPLKDGTVAKLTLAFAKAGELALDMPVRTGPAKAGGDHHDHH